MVEETKVKLSSLNEETFRLKFRNLIYLPLTKTQRRKKLREDNFTIISNNCWGGHVYRYFNMPYDSPTIGLFFESTDYIKFISNLKHYINQELRFITFEESRNKDMLIR